jgi:hypothetical protein
LLVAVLVMFVAVLVTVMAASGTAPPLWSRIVPTRLPTSNWACAELPTRNSDTAKEKVRNARLIMLFMIPDDS